MEDKNLYNEAIKIVQESNKGSILLLTKQLHIGYVRASKLIKQMEKNGIIGINKGQIPKFHRGNNRKKDL
jgi:S-DNA-T family DNA segregation ATPase FtsK/SpoIIIE